MAQNKLSFRPTIAHPCEESWAEMQGTHRERHCQLCNEQVHNFSVLTSQQIERLLTEKGGKLCARITMKKDGSLITLDSLPRASIAAQVVMSASLALGAAGAIAQNSAGRADQANAVLTGTVLKQDGSGPLAGALISIRNSGLDVITARSDDDGSFRISVPAGSYDIRFTDGPAGGSVIHNVALIEGEQQLSPIATGTTVQVEAGTLVMMGAMNTTITRKKYTFLYVLRHPLAYAKHLAHKDQD
jgi:hypothetical protein